MTLNNAVVGAGYQIVEVAAEEAGMEEFLFTLGCYPGETVTVISRLANNTVINIKNARYSIDDQLADAIRISEAGDEAPAAGARKVG